MTVGDILGRAFVLLFARFALFYTIMLIMALPILVLRLALPDLMVNGVGQLVLLPATFVLQIIGTGAMIRVVMQEYLDRPVSFADAFQFALSRFWSLLGTSLLVGIFVFLGTLACLIPGIYLAIAFSMASAVVIVENKAGMDAVSRSKRLVEGHFGRVLGILFLVGIINGCVEGGIAAIGGIVLPFSSTDPFSTNPFGRVHVSNYGNYAVFTSLDTLVQIFFQAYIAICSTLIYFDLRNRKEAFDLELEADKLDAWTEHFQPRSYPESQDIQTAEPGIQPPGAAVEPRSTGIRPAHSEEPPSGAERPPGTTPPS
jgi:hypothetical protein